MCIVMLLSWLVNSNSTNRKFSEGTVKVKINSKVKVKQLILISDTGVFQNTATTRRLRMYQLVQDVCSLMRMC